MKNIGNYSKFLVGAATAVLTGMEPYYGHDIWFTAVTAGVGALLVYMVPNTTSTAADVAPKAEVNK